VHKRLDIESQRWTDACDIFAVQLLQNGGLSGVIKTAEVSQHHANVHESQELTETGPSSPSLFAGSSELW
jgi:hypothetical protein